MQKKGERVRERLAREGEEGRVVKEEEGKEEEEALCGEMRSVAEYCP